MGQKSNRLFFVSGYRKSWLSNWFASNQKEYALFAVEDAMIRSYFARFEKKYLISSINISRSSNKPCIVINTCKPGTIIGKVDQIDNFVKDIAKIINKVPDISVQSVKRPDLNSKIVCLSLASQIEARMSYKKSAKSAIDNVMRLGAGGVKIIISGRLNGSEIARSESFKTGSIPLHTIRADIDYAQVNAITTYGVIGIKVWINRPNEFVVF